jgi:hypothetical protein
MRREVFGLGLAQVAITIAACVAVMQLAETAGTQDLRSAG